MSAADRLAGWFVAPVPVSRAEPTIDDHRAPSTLLADAAIAADPSTPPAPLADPVRVAGEGVLTGAPPLSAVALVTPSERPDRARRKSRPRHGVPSSGPVLRMVAAVVDDAAAPRVVEDARADAEIVDGPRPRTVACGVRVCVLGGGRAGVSFARALVARLARLPGARSAVLCTVRSEGDAASRAPGLSGPPAGAARRAARGLVAEGHDASARGRVVEVALDDGPGAIAEVLADLDVRAAGAPTLVSLPGVRSAALDVVVAGHDVVLVVVDANASSALSTLAVAELSRLAPGAVVRAVPLPARLGAGARRTAVALALEAVR